MLSQSGWPIPQLPYKFWSPPSIIPFWRTFPHEILSVFPFRPLGDDIEVLYAHAAEADVDRALPVRKFGASNKYIRTEYAQHVHDLRAKILDQQPNVIVALGPTSTWALGLGASITKLRGYVHSTEFGKVLPTFSPASILRKWNNRITMLVDLTKARRESVAPGFAQVEREIWVEPSIDDLWLWWETYGKASPLLAFDIETLKQRQISEIGFASDRFHALHIPFCWKEGNTYHNFFKTAAEEVEAWKFVKHVCESNVPKVAQNCLYDTYFLAKELNISVKNTIHDTMQMSHAWSPEMQKSLSFLASIFCDEKSWKQIRHFADKDKGEI
jgi:hypothetical protein